LKATKRQKNSYICFCPDRIKVSCPLIDTEGAGPYHVFFPIYFNLLAGKLIRGRLTAYDTVVNVFKEKGFVIALPVKLCRPMHGKV
jgi:hypothetical protein